jgi:hypothetical protein
MAAPFSFVLCKVHSARNARAWQRDNYYINFFTSVDARLY